MHGPQRCRVLFLAPYPVPATGRAGEGEGWALPTSLASCPVPALSLGYSSLVPPSLTLFLGKGLKPARQLQPANPASLCPALLALRKQIPRFLLLVEDHPPVWKPHKLGILVSSQIVSSDITFSKGWQRAGTADVTPAHSLVLDLTPGGDSDPSILGWGLQIVLQCSLTCYFRSMNGSLWPELAHRVFRRIWGAEGRIVTSSLGRWGHKGACCAPAWHMPCILIV